MCTLFIISQLLYGKKLLQDNMTLYSLQYLKCYRKVALFRMICNGRMYMTTADILSAHM